MQRQPLSQSDGMVGALCQHCALLLSAVQLHMMGSRRKDKKYSCSKCSRHKNKSRSHTSVESSRCHTPPQLITNNTYSKHIHHQPSHPPSLYQPVLSPHYATTQLDSHTNCHHTHTLIHQLSTCSWPHNCSPDSPWMPPHLCTVPHLPARSPSLAAAVRPVLS